VDREERVPPSEPPLRLLPVVEQWVEGVVVLAVSWFVSAVECRLYLTALPQPFGLRMVCNERRQTKK